MDENKTIFEVFGASLTSTTQVLDENTVNGRVHYRLYDYHRDSHKFGGATLNIEDGRHLTMWFTTKEEMLFWIENYAGSVELR